MAMTVGDSSGKSLNLSVIVPIYNEGELLMGMAENLAVHLDAIVGEGQWQFVLVDNGSTDSSPQVCQEIVTKWPASTMIRLDRPDYGDALHTGLLCAEAPWAYIMNVDFWDAPFLRWCFRTRGVYDLVMGSKRADFSLSQQHAYRRLLSWGLNTLLQTIFGSVCSDTHGQKFLHLPTMRPILEKCVMRRGQFDTEFTLRAMRARLWLAEVPVPLVELRRPRNFMFQKIYRNLVDIFRLYKAMKAVPVQALRYHRWAREDIEFPDMALIAMLEQMRAIHSRPKQPQQSLNEP